MAKSLQSEFVKYYKEKLSPLGYQKVKGRQPYFIRVVNDEILHIITFLDKGPKKGFCLESGIATVYRKEFNFSVTPRHNDDWLRSLGDIVVILNSEYPVRGKREKSMFYPYTEENISQVVEESFSGAEIIIGIQDPVTTMTEVAKYILKYQRGDICFLALTDDSFCDEEGLFYARKEFDYSIIDHIFEQKWVDLHNSGLTAREKEHSITVLHDWETMLKTERDTFIKNEKEYEEGMSLLEKHYHDNIKKLKEYGLHIKEKVD